MSDVDKLIDLKQKAQEASETLGRFAYAVDAYLGELPPPTEDPRGYGDYGDLKWTEKDGSKGPYQQTTKAANNNSPEFQSLQGKLRDRNGFMQTKGYKFWNHREDRDTIDRRAK